MDIGFNKKLWFKPESVIKIQSVFLFILSVFSLDFMQAKRAVSRKKRQKETDREQKDG